MSNSRNGQGGEEDRAGKRGKSDEAVDKERERAVDAAMAQIEKQHGKGAIMRLGDKQDLLDGRGVISTGSLGIDIALGEQ